MKIINRAGLSLEEHAKLEDSIQPYRTLQALTVWGRGQTPPVLLVDSIPQDEYTHDVIATWRRGMVLVVGAT
jgi:hypothetical protein